MQTSFMRLNIQDDPLEAEEPDHGSRFPSTINDPPERGESRRAELRDWMAATGNSPNATAALMGQPKSKGELAAWLENPAVGLSSDLVTAIDGLLEDPGRLVGSLRDIIFCQTSIAADFWELFQFCEQERAMGAAFCPAGTGKTLAAQEFKRQHPDTILLTSNIKKRSSGAVLKEFAEALGFAYYGERAGAVVIEKIAETLFDYTPTVVIDESHLLGFEAFESLRAIHDLVPFPLICLGQETLLDVMRDRTKRKQWDQITSRLTIRRRLGNSITKNDVGLIARSFCKKLDAQSLAYLHRVAQGEGRFRTMTNLLKLSLKMGRGKVNLRVLREAKKFLMI